MQKKIAHLRKTMARSSLKARKRTEVFIQNRPLISFGAALLVLLAVIIVGSILRKPESDVAAVEKAPTPVEVFQIGATPQVQVQAQVEKSGVITIIAQSAGVVQKLNVAEGDVVKRGTSLVNLSTNYQGATLPSVSRQIAQKSYQFSVDNYQAQLDSINNRRELSNKVETQAADLRSIGEKSLSDTRTLISQQEEIYSYLDSTVKSLENSGADAGSIATARQSRAGVLSALSALRSALRSTEYQTSNDKIPADLGRLQRDLTLKQLNLEEKSLNLSKEISGLNLRLSQIAESLLYPASPCPGIVERVYVQVGQSVSPGTIIATITADANVADVIALVPQQVAREISTLQPAQIKAGSQDWEVYPRYVSTEPTNGNLYSVFFTLPTALSELVAQGEFVSVTLALSAPELKVDHYVPVDAVFQTESGAYVYVVDTSDGRPKAITKEVKLSSVLGKYVTVLSGLADDDQIITTRNVGQGDTVAIQ